MRMRHIIIRELPGSAILFPYYLVRVTIKKKTYELMCVRVRVRACVCLCVFGREGCNKINNTIKNIYYF
jgi:hypothetical protein